MVSTTLSTTRGCGAQGPGDDVTPQAVSHCAEVHNTAPCCPFDAAGSADQLLRGSLTRSELNIYGCVGGAAFNDRMARSAVCTLAYCWSRRLCWSATICKCLCYSCCSKLKLPPSWRTTVSRLHMCGGHDDDQPALVCSEVQIHLASPRPTPHSQQRRASQGGRGQRLRHWLAPGGPEEVGAARAVRGCA
jgi:hypothetical protein